MLISSYTEPVWSSRQGWQLRAAESACRVTAAHGDPGAQVICSPCARETCAAPLSISSTALMQPRKHCLQCEIKVCRSAFVWLGGRWKGESQLGTSFTVSCLRSCFSSLTDAARSLLPVAGGRGFSSPVHLLRARAGRESMGSAQLLARCPWHFRRKPNLPGAHQRYCAARRYCAGSVLPVLCSVSIATCSISTEPFPQLFASGCSATQ